MLCCVAEAAPAARTALPSALSARSPSMSDADVTALPVPPNGGAPGARPRIKKLRLLGILLPLGVLAIVSTVFGMMMAVASDLPSLTAAQQLRHARNSVIYDSRGVKLGILTTNENRILVPYTDIAPSMKSAVIAVEDKRFFQNSGVDLRGIARAFVQDLIAKRSAQGGSTITQQFVKNALKAQGQRTVFQKLREAALAYHLTRKWSKEDILTNYLNSIYFGNGAYGIESAARTYFGKDPNHAGCGERVTRPCAKELQPWESALLAGVIASPTAFDPVAHPGAAKHRRDLVLRDMLAQGRLPRVDYDNAIQQPLWSGDLDQPRVRTDAPYFTTWVRQQLIDRFGPEKAFEGGLKIKTTLDFDMQKAAETAISKYLSYPLGPTASLVAIDNKSGEVRAMVGGRDYAQQPFNLATQGQRQPGSSFKPFILAQALKSGASVNDLWPSRRRDFVVPGTHGREHFPVTNFEGSYAGVRSLGQALTFSDNSVFAAAGIHYGTRKIARLARRMGIRTPVSHNLAMTLGGLKEGVSPLDMAHAYETFATGGRRVSGTLGANEEGPVGIEWVRRISDDKLVKENKPKFTRVLSPQLTAQEVAVMQTVVSQGTAKRAAYGGFAAGKTGTTENYGDAWFIGFTDKMTIAVWVGYPNGNTSMAHDFGGAPVEGGTYPAQIWHDFVVAANAIVDEREAERVAKINEKRAKKGLPPLGVTTSTTTSPAPVAPAPSTTPQTTTTPAPQQQQTPAPQQQQQTTPSTGGTGGGTAPPADGTGTAAPDATAQRRR
jgi:penicillin-binding protein 1A